MTTYSAILFIHVAVTLALAAAMTGEAIASQRSTLPATTLTRLRIASSLCLLVLFLSGGYLTERLSLWPAAWPKVAVAVVLAFGALAGIAGRRIRAGNASFIWTSLKLRTGLVLAAVFLMTVKPGVVAALCAALGLPLICLALRRPSGAPTSNA